MIESDFFFKLHSFSFTQGFVYHETRSCCLCLLNKLQALNYLKTFLMEATKKDKRIRNGFCYKLTDFSQWIHKAFWLERGWDCWSHPPPPHYKIIEVTVGAHLLCPLRTSSIQVWEAEILKADKGYYCSLLCSSFLLASED